MCNKLLFLIMILTFFPNGVSASETILLIDFGINKESNSFGLEGWETAIFDRYTENRDIGPGGSTIRYGSNKWYNYQGIKGDERSFLKGDSIVVTWYNDHNESITFTPYISFLDDERISSKEIGEIWHTFPETTIKAKEKGTSTFRFSPDTQGFYSVININSHHPSTLLLIADKIELIKDEEYINLNDNLNVGSQKNTTMDSKCNSIHEADIFCGNDGEDECGISFKELRLYAKRVIKFEKTLFDLVDIIKLYNRLEQFCPQTYSKKIITEFKNEKKDETQESEIIEENKKKEQKIVEKNQFQLDYFRPSLVNSDAHFDNECLKQGVIGCRDFGSVEDVIKDNDVGVPNSPNAHGRKTKCQFSECENCPINKPKFCVPFFLEGNCELKDELLITLGRSQETKRQATLWSPCFDSNVDAVRLTYWNDLGSSIQSLGAVKREDSGELNEIWTQFEISFSENFFFDPKGSSTSKLYRMYRKKNGNCRDSRFSDMRLSRIGSDYIEIKPMVYCLVGKGNSYGNQKDKTAVKITPDKAGNWIRITTYYNLIDNTMSFWTYDVTDKTLLVNGTTILTLTEDESSYIPRGFGDITSLGFLVHSTSHKADESRPSPNFWVRHVILSNQPITP